MMDQTQIDRAALAIHALRPDWRADSLRTFIGGQRTTAGLALADMAWRDVVLALSWVACDPETRVPSRVLSPGPWWEAARPMQVQPTPAPPPLRSTSICQGCNRDAAGHEAVNRMCPSDAHPWMTLAEVESRRPHG